ncbi:MAG TPA: 2,6-beta-D-fructofuranosidase [Lentisphaeria bacterium]|nr:MAG: hypothetical protein A2X45_07640 [Lentisphaerae bacterium GWF2_50_93]HCE44279.1 2,6-beta-D-fructofuranosidase [Lentisphaeria bacterium]
MNSSRGSDRYRPLFHFTSAKGWLNDPNGMVFYKGEYHLFFQLNPSGTEWGNMTWGQAISTDLVHWKQLPNAIEIDSFGHVFSGTAVVDWKNTSGFRTGAEDVIVAFYTAEGQMLNPKKPTTQCIAFSNDRGRTFVKYSGNPIIDQITVGNRDPKVFWHEPSKRWIMVLYVEEKRDENKVHTFKFFNSTDLKKWEQTGSIDGFYECPEFFELPKEGNEKDKKWVLLAADSGYLIGTFDGKSFTPESSKMLLDHGRSFYAAQTFNDIPASDGRRIIIGWMRGGKYPDMPFSQQMGFPSELTLGKRHGQICLIRKPVMEIELLRKESLFNDGFILKSGTNPFNGIIGDAFELKLKTVCSGSQGVSIGFHGQELVYQPANGTLSVCGNSVSVGKCNQLDIAVLIDRTSVEIFADDGAISMSECFIPDGSGKISLEPLQGDLTVSDCNLFRVG